MTLIYRLFILLTLMISIGSCEEEKPSSGLVSFAELPVYKDGILSFSAYVQYGREGKQVECYYQVLEGPFIVEEGILPLSVRQVEGTIWVSPPAEIPLDSIQYSGRVLMISLDPENKITSQSYRDPLLVEFYKQDTIFIP